MPPERTKELVDQLRTWYKAGTTRQMDLAASLGLRPQQLAEILAGRNRPTGEQALQIAEFLETENMKSELVDPPKMPRETTRDPNEPKTLGSAKEMLAELRDELAQLKTGALPAAPKVVLPAASTRQPPASRSATSIQAPARQPRVNEPMEMASQPQKLRLSATLDTPASIQAALDGMNDAALRLSLFGTCSDEVERLQQTMILRELKRRRE